jgi:hypothetical protein
VFPNDDQLDNTDDQNPQMEIIGTETFDEEYYFSFQSVVFYIESKNLIIEKRDVNNKKGKYRLYINLWNMRPSQISQIHQESRDSMDNSIECLEAENVRLKERIKELEGDLMTLPMLATPLEMIGPTTPTEKLKGLESFLTSARGYVENNINKRMELIIESWEMSKSMVSFGTRSNVFHE